MRSHRVINFFLPPLPSSDSLESQLSQTEAASGVAAQQEQRKVDAAARENADLRRRLDEHIAEVAKLGEELLRAKQSLATAQDGASTTQSEIARHAQEAENLRSDLEKALREVKELQVAAAKKRLNAESL